MMRPGRMMIAAVAVPLAVRAIRRVGQQMQARNAEQSMGGQKPSKMHMMSGRGSRYAGSRW